MAAGESVLDGVSSMDRSHVEYGVVDGLTNSPVMLGGGNRGKVMVSWGAGQS